MLSSLPASDITPRADVGANLPVNLDLFIGIKGESRVFSETKGAKMAYPTISSDLSVSIGHFGGTIGSSTGFVSVELDEEIDFKFGTSLGIDPALCIPDNKQDNEFHTTSPTPHFEASSTTRCSVEHIFVAC